MLPSYQGPVLQERVTDRSRVAEDGMRFKIVLDTKTTRSVFNEWRESLMDGAIREGNLWRQPSEQFVFRNQHQNTKAVLGHRTALGVDPTGTDWVVQIHESKTPGDQQVWTAVAENQERQRYIVRQGRLHANRVTQYVDLETFRKYAGLEPIRIKHGAAESTEKWYIVTPLGISGDEVRRHTARFVDACERARAAVRGDLVCDDLERAAELEGAEEKGGHILLGGKAATDPKYVWRLQGEVWQQLFMQTKKSGGSMRKVRHSGGYEIDAEIVNKKRKLLVEIKTSTSAHDVYTGVGQLMLYARLFDSLKNHRPVLLVPREVSKYLLEAIRQCDVAFHTYQIEEVGGRVRVKFSDRFRKLCGCKV